MRSIFSTTDKSGIAPLALTLQQCGWQVFATEGTLSHLHSAGVEALPLRQLLTADPVMGGRVKTLDWRLFAGLLCDPLDQQHQRDAEQHRISTFDLVVSDIYPFSATVRADTALGRAQQHMDIGGTAMLRAAAKNFLNVIALADRDDYEPVRRALAERGGSPDAIGPEWRRRLAAKAFSATALQDQAIARYLEQTNAPFAQRP